MVSKRVVIPGVLIVLLTVFGCEILPKRKEPPPEQETLVVKEQAPSKMMAQFYFEEGISHYLERDLDRAITSFAEALKLDPEHPKARRMFEESLKKRVEGREQKAEHQRAEGRGQRAERRVEEVPIYKEEKGIAPKEKTTVKAAEESSEEEMAAQGTLEEEIPQEKLPPPEKEKKKKAKAEEVSKEELLWFEFAKDLKKRGIYNETIEELTRLLDEYPKTILADRIIYLRAETHSIAGEHPQAEKDYQALIDDYPQSPLLDDARLHIADSYLLRGEYDQALVKYLRLARNLKDISMKTLPQEEEDEEAITPLPQPKAILAAKAQLGVAESYRLKKNYLYALIEYYEVVRSYTDRVSRSQALYYIGYIYDFISEVRDFKRAVTAYERVVENYPESIWASYAQERKEHIERNYL